MAAILISHKLDDLYDCCDRAVVMRAGRVVGSSDCGRMIAPNSSVYRRRRTSAAGMRHGSRGAPWFRPRKWSVHRDNGTVAVDRGSFDLHAGEIIGLCGVEGNGQTELMHALAGMRAIQAGEIVYALGKQTAGQVRRRSFAAGRRGAYPRGPLHHAVIPSFTLTMNWLLRKLSERGLVAFGFLRRLAAAKATLEAISDNDVRTSGPRARMSDLSGGNQQKFVIARELGDGVAVILAGHPTRGLDIRTVATIRNRLVAERAKGVAILLLSADLSEVWDLADRVMVMTHGNCADQYRSAKQTSWKSATG